MVAWSEATRDVRGASAMGDAAQVAAAMRHMSEMMASLQASLDTERNNAARLQELQNHIQAHGQMLGAATAGHPDVLSGGSPAVSRQAAAVALGHAQLQRRKVVSRPPTCTGEEGQWASFAFRLENFMAAAFGRGSVRTRGVGRFTVGGRYGGRYRPLRAGPLRRARPMHHGGQWRPVRRGTLRAPGGKPRRRGLWDHCGVAAGKTVRGAGGAWCAGLTQWGRTG